VLVEGDDPQEPIADTVRGLLDGHTWLSRKIAARGHYPAVDVLASLSRLMTDITERGHQDAAQGIRELLAAYRDHEDLISIGAYRRGANRTVDLAIELLDEINAYLRQRIDERVTANDASERLIALYRKVQARQAALTAAGTINAGAGAAAVGGAATATAGTSANGPTVRKG
ncbi:MAG: hypothetical protein SGJ20_04225, partial [Planctomycetota bacterium]|nr:hypothetical protein [Planctomycetota bacterium]